MAIRGLLTLMAYLIICPRKRGRMRPWPQVIGGIHLPPTRDVTSDHWREEKTARMRFSLRVFAIIAFFIETSKKT
jgi:hypothetical protein